MLQKSMTKADPNLKIRQGARLPHWTREGATYAVTFRLGDSLPKVVLDSWKFERQDIMRTAKQLGRSLTSHEEKRLDKLFSEKVDKHLDEGQGKCWMREDSIARVVAGALEFFDGTRYRLSAWCVMPNHVHVVLEPMPGHELPEILHSWKSYTSKEINNILGTKGQLWEVEYYDHLIRDESDLQAQIEYVMANPQKAGLKNWKWVGVARASRP
jgi:REP element-mobilizing transposase RayT